MPGNAGRAFALVVSVMKCRARLFHVRASVGTLAALENRRERQKHLGDGKEQKRRTPKRSGEYSRVRHEGHTGSKSSCSVLNVNGHFYSM